MSLEESYVLKDYVAHIISIFPSDTDAMKNIFINRYKKRGNNISFINLIYKNWSNFIDDMKNSKIPTDFIELDENTSGISEIQKELFPGLITSISGKCDESVSLYGVESFCTFYRAYGETYGIDRGLFLTYDDALNNLPKSRSDYNYFVYNIIIDISEKETILKYMNNKNNVEKIKVIINQNKINKIFLTAKDAGIYEDEMGRSYNDDISKVSINPIGRKNNNNFDFENEIMESARNLFKDMFGDIF